MDTIKYSEIESILSTRLSPSSDFMCGFANLNGLLPDEYKNYMLGISIGKRLDDKIVNSVAQGPNTNYYNHYKQVNSELEIISKSIVDDLADQGIKSIAIVPTLVLSSEEFKPYFKELKYKISHKMVATRAGLGWIDKTDLFVSKKFGPRLRLVSILVESNIKSDALPIDESHCMSSIRTP